MSVGPAIIERIACQHMAGSTIYCIVIREDSYIYNGSGFEAATVAGWPGYAVPLVDAAGVGMYSADVPTAIVGGYYRVFACVRDGDIPAPTDPVVAAGTIGESTAAGPIEPGTPTSVPVDHDTGGTDALRYVNSSGIGIYGASILVYRKADWDSGLRDSTRVVDSTTTRSDGRWANVVQLEPGDYVVMISYPGYQASITYITV